MGLLAWIVFGGLAGWVAGMIAGTHRRQGCLLNVIIGVIGAFIGGILMRVLTGHTYWIGFDLQSFAVAVIGSVILLAIAGLARR